jgi:hypothetical protein
VRAGLTALEREVMADAGFLCNATITGAGSLLRCERLWTEAAPAAQREASAQRIRQQFDGRVPQPRSTPGDALLPPPPRLAHPTAR